MFPLLNRGIVFNVKYCAVNTDDIKLEFTILCCPWQVLNISGNQISELGSVVKLQQLRALIANNNVIKVLYYIYFRFTVIAIFYPVYCQ